MTLGSSWAPATTWILSFSRTVCRGIDVGHNFAAGLQTLNSGIDTQFPPGLPSKEVSAFQFGREVAKAAGQGDRPDVTRSPIAAK